MIKRPCLDCGQLTPGTRCRGCRNRRQRQSYGHRDYRALGRPSGPCALRIKCDGAPATTFDHIDGDRFNHHPSNIQPACAKCNSSKQDRRL